LKLVKSYASGNLSSSDIFETPAHGSWQARFELYANGLRVRTKESMEEMYPRLVRELSGDDWNTLGSDYLASDVKWPRNLNELGLELPEFMAANGSKECHIDLAKFERDLHLSFNAFDSKETLSLEEFGAIDENSHFEFQASMYLISSNWNLFSHLKDASNEWTKKSEFGVIYRLNFKVKYFSISKDEFNFLSVLKNRNSLGDSLNAAGPFDPEQLSGLLAKIFAIKVVTKIAAA